MPVIKKQSLRDVLYLQDRMNKIFEDSLRPMADNPGPGQWMPYTDIYEDDKSITIKTELPGLQKEDIIIDVSGATLSIGGRKKRHNDDIASNHHIIERQYGSFKRSFSLPPDVDAEKIKAGFENGVLEIVLTKEKTCASRKILISTN